jgi:DNA polymerase V
MKQKIFMLVDALQFYVSVERAFQMELRNKPIVVVGNNDGCIVTLSQEAKQLGLRRGQQLFQCEPLIRKHQVQVYSSNYPLYDSMSKRMMAVVADFSPRLEVYSIDEAFGELTDQGIEDLTAFGRVLQARVLQWLSIPVRVCFAPTKVLAKIGAHLVKTDTRYADVLDLTGWTATQLDTALEQVPVEDIWGVGPNSARVLHNYGIRTARQLRDADERWIKRTLTVVGARIQQELKGVFCFPLQIKRKPKQQIVYTRTFGRTLTTLSDLEEAVSAYTARAAVRLRQQATLAGRVTVFAQTSLFDATHQVYANDFTLDLRHPTAFTPTLLEYAPSTVMACHSRKPAWCSARFDRSLPCNWTCSRNSRSRNTTRKRVSW